MMLVIDRTVREIFCRKLTSQTDTLYREIRCSIASHSQAAFLLPATSDPIQSTTHIYLLRLYCRALQAWYRTHNRDRDQSRRKDVLLFQIQQPLLEGPFPGE